MDSKAKLNQWRLVLNGVPNGDNPHDAPTFDETRHASICVEVCCSQCNLFFPSPLMLSGLIVEIPVCCNYPGPEQPLDCGQLQVS